MLSFVRPRPGDRARRAMILPLLALCAATTHAAVAPGATASPGTPAPPVAGRLASPAKTIAAWQNFLGLKQAVGKTYRERGMTAYQDGDLRIAAQNLSLATDFDPDDTESHGRLGFARKEIGDYEGAVAALGRAILQDPGEYQYHWWLGDVQRMLGDYEASAQSLLAARDLAPQDRYDELNDFVEFTRALGSDEKSWMNFDRHVQLAMRHDGVRRSRRCIDEYLRAAAVAPEISDEDNNHLLRRGLAYVNAGTQYTFLKEPDVAILYFERAHPLFVEGKLPVWSMRTHQNAAVAYRVWAGTEQARRAELLAEGAREWGLALGHAESAGDIEYQRYARGAMLRDLVEAHGLDGEGVAELREQNLTELPFRGPINDYSVASVALGELACRVAEGDFAGQRIIIEMVTPYYDEPRFLLDTEEAARLKAHLANVYNHQGHHNLAMQTATDAFGRFSGIRDYIDAEAFSRSDNELNLRHAATSYLRAAIASDSLPMAFEIADRFRRSQADDLLGSRIRDEARYTDTAAEEALLRARIPEFEAELSAAEAARDARLSALLRDRVAKDQARLAWLERRVAPARPNTMAYRSAPTIDLVEARAALPADVTTLFFAFDRIGGVALALSRDTQQAVVIDGMDEATVRRLVADCRAALARDPAAAEALLGQLHDLLIAPVRDHLKTPVLQISPDEALHHLPFEALHRGGRALIDDFTIAYTPSASELLRLMARERTAKDQVRALLRGAANYPESAFAAYAKSDRLTDDDATEAAALDPAGAAILHISAPADFSPTDAMWAAVELAADAKHDGQLHAAEWFAAHRPASLVLLDLEHQLDPDGVRGTELLAFAEAVFHAGGAALIANLWTPSAVDRAAVLADFHKNLATMGRAEALRAAKLAQRERTPGYAWTAFTLRGDHR